VSTRFGIIGVEYSDTGTGDIINVTATMVSLLENMLLEIQEENGRIILKLIFCKQVVIM
jgi:hypothetical protein